jgi:hypothetical protein
MSWISGRADEPRDLLAASQATPRAEASLIPLE